MGINNINVLTLSNKRLELFNFICRAGMLKLKESVGLPIKDILDITDEDIKPLLEKGINGKYFTVVDCSYESLKNIFVFNQETNDIKNKTINSFKNKYEVKLTDFYIDIKIQNFENYIVSYVVASPKNYVDVIAGFLNKNGGRLLCMESDIDSLNRFSPVKKEMYLNIHLKNRSSLALISQGNVILSERLITFGYKDMLESLAESGGISVDNAKETLERRGILDFVPESEEDRNYQNAVVDIMDRVSVEIQKSFDLFQQNIRGRNPGKIVLSGNLKDVPGAEKYYSKLFNTEVKIFNMLGFVESGLEVKNLSEDFGTLEIAAGAAMRRKF